MFSKCLPFWFCPARSTRIFLPPMFYNHDNIKFNLKNSSNALSNSMLTGTHNIIYLTFTLDLTSSFNPKASISDCLSSNSTYPNPLSLPWSVGSLTLTTYNQDIKIYKLIVHIQMHHKILFFMLGSQGFINLITFHGVYSPCDVYKLMVYKFVF